MLQKICFGRLLGPMLLGHMPLGHMLLGPMLLGHMLLGHMLLGHMLCIFFLHVGYSLEGNVRAFRRKFSYVYETVGVMAVKGGTMHKTLRF